MKIYFDSCAIQRPLDNIDHLRIVLEIEALAGIFKQIDLGTVDLVSSEVLELEIDGIASSTRRGHALHLLAQAKEFVEINEQVERRAQYFVSLGVKVFDALHLACAEGSAVDYFCTCDDRLLRRSRLISDLALKVGSPLELIEEIDI